MLRHNINAERLGWFDHKINPEPVVFPDKSKVSFLNDKLKKSPVIIPVNGWPAGTKSGRKADWSWRIENVIDDRKESERPAATQVASLEETDDIMENLRKIASRHIEQAKKVNYTRQILFKSNLGLVSFEKPKDGALHVIHSLYATPFDGKPERYKQMKFLRCTKFLWKLLKRKKRLYYLTIKNKEYGNEPGFLQSAVGKIGEFFQWLKDKMEDDQVRRETLLDLGLNPDKDAKLTFPTNSINNINEYQKSVNPDDVAFKSAVNDVKITLFFPKEFIKAVIDDPRKTLRILIRYSGCFLKL